MHNVSYELKNDKLIITVDINKSTIQSARPSSTGRTFLVGTTGGKISLPVNGADVSFALNVMVKK